MYPASYSPRSRAVEIDDAGLRTRAPLSPATWNLAVRITAPGQTYTVDINTGTDPEIRVDWGDGVVETFTTTGQKTHTYQLVKTHTVRIGGRFRSDGNIRLGSNTADRARLIRTGVIPFIPGLSNFRSTFENTGLTGSIPTTLFRYNTAVSTIGFYQTFYGCSGLTGSIPTDLFRYNTLVSTSGFLQTFRGCTGLTSIPTDLFRYNTLVSTNGFYATFYNCTGLTSIPTDLFRYNTLVSTSGFLQTFYSCTGLTSIPTDLFRYNTLVSTSGFYQTFRGCTGLTSIPTDLFRYNTLVSTSGFLQTFLDCTGITGSIPADLFRYNTLVSTSGFNSTFTGCTGLTSAPSLLFAYVPDCDSFQSVFQNCNKLQLPADLFSAAGDKGTRFLNKTVNFTNALRIGTFTGTQGTAPDLWNYDFGSGTPTKTACFTGHTVSSVSNFANIPAEWK